MDKADIIDLYNRVIVYDPTLPGPPKRRLGDYARIKSEVEAMRTRLIGGGIIDIVADIHFLEELISTPRNGVAQAGQGSIGGQNFRSLISDANFIKSLEEAIKNPCAVAGERLLTDVEMVCHKKYKLIVNRIIAASTERVSSIVSNKQLAKVFKDLVDDGIIKRGSHKVDSKVRTVTEWYDKNVHMVDELRNLIKKGTGTDPEPTALSKLPWYIIKEPNPTSSSNSSSHSRDDTTNSQMRK